MLRFLNQLPSQTRARIGMIIVLTLLVGAAYLTLSTPYVYEPASPTDTEATTVLKQGNPTDGWKSYRNTKYSYKLKFPPDWRCRTAVGQSGVVFCSTSFENIIFEPANTSLKGSIAGLEVSVLNTSYDNVLNSLEADVHRKSPIRDVSYPGFAGKQAEITGITGEDYAVIIFALDARQTVRFTYRVNPETEQILSTFKFIQ